LRRSDTAAGHLVFDLTVMLQAHKARDESESKAQERRTISVADLTAALTE